MSIASEITRLQSAKSALKTAINSKNDNSHQIDDETLEDYAGFVDTIQTGAAPVVEVPSRDVNFYDYDGRIMYSYTAADFQNLTELPANPTHSGLTAQGWNWTLADAKAQVTAVGACDIGQMYVTTDGKTRLYCTFEDFNKSFYFGLGVNGTATIDWGDESATDTLTGTNNATTQNIQHTYATAGDYVITLTVSSGGSFAFLGGSNCSYLFREETSNVSRNQAYMRCLKKIEMGSGAYIRGYCFRSAVNLETISINNNAFYGSIYLALGCPKLKFITIPDTTTSFGQQVFQYCGNIENLSLPKSVTTSSSNVLNNALKLRRFVFPNAVTTIGIGTFNSDYSLQEVYLSNNVTSIPASTFASCINLRKITIPASVTSIATKAFQGCYCMKEYHFKSTTPPTLDNVDAFNNIASDCVIYVPSAKLNDYKTATNWSTYASYMVGE